MTSRYWCFTLNNPENDYPDFNDPKWKKNVKFCVYQKEKGESGTIHLQGYIVLLTPRRLTWLKSNFGNRYHLEKRRGTHEEAVKYCIKEDSRVELPVIYPTSIALASLVKTISNGSGGGGQLSKLQLMKMKIDSGATDLELAEEDFQTWVRHYKAFSMYRMLKSTPRNHAMHVCVFQGPTGTGKSRFAHESYPGAYWKQRSQWWDLYVGQPVTILDEFYGWLPWDTLLRLCDRYPLLVQTKGGQVQFSSEKIIITTNRVPDKWYKSCYFPAFVRRVSEWHVFPEEDKHLIFEDYSDALKHMQDFVGPLNINELHNN